MNTLCFLDWRTQQTVRSSNTSISLWYPQKRTTRRTRRFSLCEKCSRSFGQNEHKHEHGKCWAPKTKNDFLLWRGGCVLRARTFIVWTFLFLQSVFEITARSDDDDEHIFCDFTLEMNLCVYEKTTTHSDTTLVPTATFSRRTEKSKQQQQQHTGFARGASCRRQSNSRRTKHEVDDDTQSSTAYFPRSLFVLSIFHINDSMACMRVCVCVCLSGCLWKHGKYHDAYARIAICSRQKE